MGSMDPSSMIAGCAKTYDNFPLIFLLEKAALLLEYKKGENREGAPGCSTDHLHHQISNVVYLFGNEAIAHWDNLMASSSEFCNEQLFMIDPKKEYFEVVELDPAQVFGKGSNFLHQLL